jgi:hypothetical protein
VHGKVQQDGGGVVGQDVVDVEEEAVEGVLEDRPDDVTSEEAGEGLSASCYY